MALKCGHCGSTNLGDNFGFFSTKVHCKDCGATTCYKNPSGKLKWVKGGSDDYKKNNHNQTDTIRMSGDELREKMRLGEKKMDSITKNISKIDWWTGDGSGRI